jgi:hypothetical protein
MKYLKDTAKDEQLLQELEALLEKNKMTLTYGCNGFIVTIEDKDYVLRDIDNHEGTRQLPRTFDSEKMTIVE